MPEPFVYVALPQYAPGGKATSIPYDLLDATAHPDRLYIPPPTNKSLLARNFNNFWCDALNKRKTDGITHLLLHHDDIDVVTEQYIDFMLGKMKELSADVLSVVVPIKNQTGVTTTGWRTANPKMEQNDIKRYTMKQLAKMPLTFDREGAGLGDDKWLMVNTGILLCDFTKPWVQDISFEIRDWIIARSDGTYTPTGISEDWKFSSFCAIRGLRVFATREVRLAHWGPMQYVNWGAWGIWETDQGDVPLPIEEPDDQTLPPSAQELPPPAEVIAGKLQIIWHAGLAPKPGTPINVISVTDPGEPGFADPYKCEVINRLHLEFHNIEDFRAGMMCPSLYFADQIINFAKEHRDLPLALQCTDGRFRSQAIAAGLTVLDGGDDRPIRRRGTYNRSLYKFIREAGGNPAPPEPKVSITVAAWNPAHMAAFYLCMYQQRHKNWELIPVSDGPAQWLKRMFLEQYGDSRVRYIETETHKGHWGHPYRQVGLDNCTGDFIGMQNDDNYLTPGYLDQMVLALEDDRADIVLCHMLHNYFGWGHIGLSLDPIGVDLGCWIARVDLVKSVPWTGNQATSDQMYVKKLIDTCGMNRVAIIKRPLFTHN